MSNPPADPLQSHKKVLTDKGFSEWKPGHNDGFELTRRPDSRIRVRWCSGDPTNPTEDREMTKKCADILDEAGFPIWEPSAATGDAAATADDASTD